MCQSGIAVIKEFELKNSTKSTEESENEKVKILDNFMIVPCWALTTLYRKY